MREYAFPFPRFRAPAPAPPTAEQQAWAQWHAWQQWHAAQQAPAAVAAADDGFEFALDGDALASFAAMERRRAQRPGGGGGGGGSARPRDPTFVLPEQEDEASRAALAAARARPRRQEALYGARAPEVRALEAALNEAFDRITASGAEHWPAIPLR